MAALPQPRRPDEAGLGHHARSGSAYDVRPDPTAPSPAEHAAPGHAPTLREVRRTNVGRLFLAIIVFGLVAVLGSPLALNVAAMYSDWQVARLEERGDELAAERAALQAQAAALASGERIQENAERLGLHPADDVEYVELAGESNGHASVRPDGEIAAATR